MTTLNLTATGKSQELILAYLQENASDVLAEKINNGVPVEKNGKTLISKKDLNGFMRFATDEAKKFTEKGGNSACVEDAVVYGWAMHYFEENSIEGKLFNPDGTEYVPPKPAKKVAATTPVKVEPPKPKQQQASLWDMMNAEKTEPAEEEKEIPLQADDHEVIDDTDEESDSDFISEELAETVESDPSIDEIADALQRAVDEQNKAKELAPKKNVPFFYTQYLELQECYPDSIILMRCRDFYEAFESDAESLSDELDLTLTSRKLTEDERVPMVGFPYHASDTYLTKIRARHSVVVTETNGDVVTLAKTVKADGKTVDTDTGEVIEEIEELTEPEMREFDGDIQEPKTSVEEVAKETPPYSLSSFDKETAAYLFQLLDGKMEIA